ncbi:helix-turn-helix domain-containing protein [Motilimonas pumila]|uniref:helix-turn-helix domain-containing protein n=1 Tax=Motilimonas pumila TaxID=2303987 RepID=UPI0013146FA8|nr:helix-turn-helix transcriptional regulator [Motilimonas pumila]
MDQSKYLCGIFDALQRVLKQQGITYKTLAESLSISEVTVKRVFQDRDCKMSRIVQICEVIGVPFTDVLAVAEQAPPKLDSLPVRAEHALLKTPGLLPFFMLLLNDFSVAAICQEQGISTADSYLYLRELEKIELIKLGQGDEFVWLITRPVKWSVAGPFQRVLISVNQRFVKTCIEQHHDAPMAFQSAARKISESTKEKFEQALAEVYRDFQKQASLDQLYYDQSELHSHKLLLAFSTFEIRNFCQVPDFKQG